VVFVCSTRQLRGESKREPSGNVSETWRGDPVRTWAGVPQQSRSRGVQARRWHLPLCTWYRRRTLIIHSRLVMEDLSTVHKKLFVHCGNIPANAQRNQITLGKPKAGQDLVRFSDGEEASWVPYLEGFAFFDQNIKNHEARRHKLRDIPCTNISDVPTCQDSRVEDGTGAGVMIDFDAASRAWRNKMRYKNAINSSPQRSAAWTDEELENREARKQYFREISRKLESQLDRGQDLSQALPIVTPKRKVATKAPQPVSRSEKMLKGDASGVASTVHVVMTCSQTVITVHVFVSTDRHHHC